MNIATIINMIIISPLTKAVARLHDVNSSSTGVCESTIRLPWYEIPKLQSLHHGDTSWTALQWAARLTP